MSVGAIWRGAQLTLLVFSMSCSPVPGDFERGEKKYSFFAKLILFGVGLSKIMDTKIFYYAVRKTSAVFYVKSGVKIKANFGVKKN